MMAGNVTTEYEEKFSGLGNPICKYVICNDNTVTDGCAGGGQRLLNPAGEKLAGSTADSRG